MKNVKQEHETLQREHQDLLLAHQEVKLKCQEAMDFAQIMKQKYLEGVDHATSLQAIVDRLSHAFYTVLGLLNSRAKLDTTNPEFTIPVIPPISDSERASPQAPAGHQISGRTHELQEQTAATRKWQRSNSGTPSRQRPLTRSVTKEKKKSSKGRNDARQSDSDDIPSPYSEEEEEEKEGHQNSNLDLLEDVINEGYLNNQSSHPYSEGVSQSILSQMLENRKKKLEAESIDQTHQAEEAPKPRPKKTGKKLRAELMARDEEEEDQEFQSSKGEPAQLRPPRKSSKALSENLSEFEFAPQSEEDQLEGEEEEQINKVQNSTDSKVVNSIASSFGITSLLKGVKNDIQERQETEDAVQRIEQNVARADKAQKEKVNFFQHDSLEDQKRQLKKTKELKPQKPKKKRSKSRKESPDVALKRKEEKKKKETKKKAEVKKYAELMPQPYMGEEESEEKEKKNEAVRRKDKKCKNCEGLKADFPYLKKTDLQKICGKH